MSKKVSKYNYWARVENLLFPMINTWSYGRATRKYFEELYAFRQLDPPDNVIDFVDFKNPDLRTPSRLNRL